MKRRIAIAVVAFVVGIGVPSATGQAGPGCTVDPPGTCFITANVTLDNVGTTNFSPTSPVTFEIFDVPGGTRLFGPKTRTTDGTGAQSIQKGRDFNFDLVDQYIVVTDEATGIAKTLQLPPLTVTVDAATDIVSGTAGALDHVSVALAEPGGTTTTGETDADDAGNWSIAFGSQIDVDQQFVQAFVADDEGDTTTAEPPPGCPARYHGGFHWYCFVSGSIENDWVSIGSFTPSSQVTFEIRQSPEGMLLYGPATVTTTASGSYFTGSLAFSDGVNLESGNVIVATDGVTGTVKTLQLNADLSLDSVDLGTNIVAGRAPAGAPVTIEGAPLLATVTAGDGGLWEVNYSDYGYTLTPEDAFSVNHFDDDGDITIDELGAPIEDPGCIDDPTAPPCGGRPLCIDDANTTCGSAGPDTIRETDGEIIAWLRDDVVLVSVGDSTDDVEIDPGKGDDGTVISPDRRHLRVSASVSIGGSAGADTTIVPEHAGGFTIDVSGGDGNDVVKTRDVGGRGSNGSYSLNGGDGNDRLASGDGRDRLNGGRGTDVLNGGRGHDVCVGTRGVDTFRSCERIVDRRHL